jgi:acyl-CoA thioesterase FadM
LSPIRGASRYPDCESTVGVYTEVSFSALPERIIVSHFISFVRIPSLAVRQYFRPLPPMGIFDEDTLHLRVLPNDIDLNLHMNNARYLSLMDYGRTHLLARTRLLGHIVRSHWQPLIGAAWLTYRRSLPLFCRFRLSSRLVCWDERWFYIEQTFTGRKGLAAVGWIKGVLRDAEGVVEPQRVIAGVAPGIQSPPIPEAMLAWNELTREKLQGGSL